MTIKKDFDTKCTMAIIFIFWSPWNNHTGNNRLPSNNGNPKKIKCELLEKAGTKIIPINSRNIVPTSRHNFVKITVQNIRETTTGLSEFLAISSVADTLKLYETRMSKKVISAWINTYIPNPSNPNVRVR